MWTGFSITESMFRFWDKCKRTSLFLGQAEVVKVQYHDTYNNQMVHQKAHRERKCYKLLNLGQSTECSLLHLASKVIQNEVYNTIDIYYRKTSSKAFNQHVSELFKGFPGGPDGKEPACKATDPGSIPGLGRSSRDENGYPLQQS